MLEMALEASLKIPQHRTTKLPHREPRQIVLMEIIFVFNFVVAFFIRSFCHLFTFQ